MLKCEHALVWEGGCVGVWVCGCVAACDVAFTVGRIISLTHIQTLTQTHIRTIIQNHAFVCAWKREEIAFLFSSTACSNTNAQQCIHCFVRRLKRKGAWLNICTIPMRIWAQLEKIAWRIVQCGHYWISSSIGHACADTELQAFGPNCNEKTMIPALLMPLWETWIALSPKPCFNCICVWALLGLPGLADVMIWSLWRNSLLRQS